MDGRQRRIALLLQYDGAPFAGSQRQRARPTVQAALEDAALDLTSEPHRMAFAGRTDSGVHATGQVAAVTTMLALPLNRWVEGLNHFLPAAVAVQAAREVPQAFDPRRDAIERTYDYRVRISRTRQPLWDRQAWVQPGPLALPPMRAALAALEGRHDFAAFAAKSGRTNTVRTMYEAAVDVVPWGLCFRFRAESFLTHQVRRMVGLLMGVGREAEAPESVQRFLAAPQAGTVRPSAPPQGLVLAQVRYQLADLTDWDTDDENVCSTES